jgi:hypothetical protein
MSVQLELYIFQHPQRCGGKIVLLWCIFTSCCIVRVYWLVPPQSLFIFCTVFLSLAFTVLFLSTSCFIFPLSLFYSLLGRVGLGWVGVSIGVVLGLEGQGLSHQS